MYERHGYSGCKIYETWNGIMKRCNHINSKNRKNYMGRGITVCEDWKRAKNFIEWALNNGYKDGLQIDRINNDGNYEPSNCRFVTHGENNAVGRRRKSTRNSSGFTGVYFQKTTGKWLAGIGRNNKFINLGVYEKIEDALFARINKEIELFGEQKTNLDCKKSNK